MKTVPSPPPSTEHRSGVVAVIGPPNAGKSTLLNRYLEQKIAIVTPLPQTTRNRILGIITGANYQMIMLDTPGLHKAKEMMNQEMVRIAMDTLTEADAVLFLVDAQDLHTLARNPKKTEKRFAEYKDYFSKITCPAFLALNKVDLLAKEQLLPMMERFTALHPFNAVVPVSALEGTGQTSSYRPWWSICQEDRNIILMISPPTPQSALSWLN
ncbi:GTP-binding protein Era [Candidatus Electrothrix communis]|uniref:GTPase Era n=1 Tax=Candidatus Electrothrix communis TaxID=1859133 RepID=A0A444J7R8_9BACT|nr:GTP-binding protein Era [Candidatus Electrothrix communis]